MSAESLEAARRELAKNPPPPLSPETHPQSFRALGELLDQREDQHRGEAAEPAA